MSQEANDNRQNNRQDSGEQRNRPNRNPKRHYRDIGDPSSTSQDRPAQGGQNANNQNANAQNRDPLQQRRQGGNQPPRNRRPKNRKPLQTAANGPVERKEPMPNRDSRNRPKQQPVEARAQSNEAVNAPKAKLPVEKSPEQDNRQNRQQRPAKQRSNQENRNNRWEKRVKPEETAEDIRRDIERIEKEIWLDIAGIHTIKLDF